jgi:hypothetical protein
MGKSNKAPDDIASDKGASHDSLMPLLQAMFREFQDASKKKADAVLNKRKVEIVNRLLADVFKILDGEHTRAYVDLLDDNDLPQNGDVVLILGQAVAAMEAFKSKYFSWDSSQMEDRWMLDDDDV